MGMDSYIYLDRYLKNGISELKKSAEEIKIYAENENYGLEAIKKSISGNKGGSLAESVFLKKSHKLTRINSESYKEPPSSDSLREIATVFDVESGTSGIIKMFSMKFLTVTTTSDTTQSFPLILRDKNGNDLFNFYIYQPRHSGSSGTYNTTIIVDLIPPDKIDTFKMYDSNNNGTIAELYAFDNSNIVGNNVYSSTGKVHIVVPQKGIAFKNGFTLYSWIQYGYNSSNYADCKLIYDKE